MALFNDDVEKAQTVLNFRHKLTPLGFEMYIARFFQEYGGFNTFQNGGYSDHGIDVKGIRTNEAGEPEYLIVQCKKWSVYPIREKDIAEFFGKIARYKFEYPNTYVVYATTGEKNIYAERFAEKNDIFLTDFSNLIEMQDEYPLDRFANEILTDRDCKPEDIFEKEIASMLTAKMSEKDQGGTRAKVLSNQSLYLLLKEVRMQLAKEEQLPLHCIFTNKALEQICTELPKSFEELRHVQGFGEKRSQKYGRQILEAVSICR